MLNWDPPTEMQSACSFLRLRRLVWHSDQQAGKKKKAGKYKGTCKSNFLYHVEIKEEKLISLSRSYRDFLTINSIVLNIRELSDY